MARLLPFLLLLATQTVLSAETSSTVTVTNVQNYTVNTTTTPVIGTQVNIAGSYELQEQVVPAIHRYAMTNGYALVAWDDNHDDESDASIGRNRIALWLKTTTNITSATTNAKAALITVKQTVTTNAISLHLQGSESGMLITASKCSGRFLPLSASGKVTGDTTGAGGQGYIPSPSATVDYCASITISDVFQAVGRFNTSKTAPVKCDALTDIVTNGICNLNHAFLAATNCPLTNITDRQAQALLNTGNLPLSFFTRDPADNSKGVFITGCDINSGSRVLTLTEVGIGALSSVNQYIYNSASNALGFSPPGAINGISYSAGNGGYFTPEDVCRVVSATSVWSMTSGRGFALNSNYTGPCYLIGYAPVKEIVRVGGTKMLSYNGQAAWDGENGSYPGSASENGITEGAYTLYSTARLYVNEANISKGMTKGYVTKVATAIGWNIGTNTTATFGYGNTAPADMAVTRPCEGATTWPR